MRDTRTGSVLEAMILPALELGGYGFSRRRYIGERLGGRKHIVDVIAADRAGCRFLISLKWQQVGGTAEQKVPFEAMCLANAVLQEPSVYRRAYIVLGGEGWTLRRFYVGGGLNEYFTHHHLVTITGLETFVARANQGQL